MPSAPPEPPSPMTTAIIGVRMIIISRRLQAMASAMLRSSAPMPGKAPGVSIMAMTGRENFSASAHEAQGLAVAFGMRAAEVAQEVLLGVAALLLADEHDAAPADRGKAAGHRVVIADVAVAVQFQELVEAELRVVEHVGPLGVAGDLDALPGGEQGVDFLLQPLEFLFQLRDLDREFFGRLDVVLAAQLVEFLARFHERFFKFQDLLHAGSK